MKTRSWIGRITFPAVAAVMALTVTLLPAAGPSVAHATSIQESAMRGGDAQHGGAGDHPRQSAGDHDWDRDHQWRHHLNGRPNGFYYIYPYNHYSYGIYRYYPVPRYPAPTYWYYCRSYGAYYPHVGSCPESWVPVPAS